MTYKPVSEVINSVLERLYSLTEGDKIDESILYNRASLLMSNFSFNHHKEGKAVLVVKNKKATLPDDFHKACMVLGCFEGTEMPQSRYDETYKLEERQVCELNVCETACDVCTDECGNMMRIVQKFNRTPIVHTQFDILNMSKGSSPFCAEGCFNNKSNSSNTISIQNGEILCEFDEGLLYVEYIAKLETDDDFMFPYHPKIEDWLQAEFIAEVFQVLYFNGEGDFLQRYQMAKTEANTKYITAKSILRTPEVGDLYNIARYLNKKYNTLRTTVFNPSTFGIYEWCPEMKHIHSTHN